MSTNKEISIMLGKAVVRNAQIKELLQIAECFYRCPKDSAGKRVGPLVGYAGKYAEGKHYVGDVYVNVAQAAQYPGFLHHITMLPVCFGGPIHTATTQADVIVGPTWGGTQLADAFGFRLEKRVCLVKENTLALATADERAKTEYVLGHELDPGDKVLIVEDLVNNRTNVGKLVSLLEAAGAIPIATLCVWDRSPKLTSVKNAAGEDIPHFAFVHEPIDQYQQDDPYVAADVEAGNVVWKVKPEWPRLQKAMRCQARNSKHIGAARAIARVAPFYLWFKKHPDIFWVQLKAAALRACYGRKWPGVTGSGNHYDPLPFI